MMMVALKPLKISIFRELTSRTAKSTVKRIYNPFITASYESTTQSKAKPYLSLKLHEFIKLDFRAIYLSYFSR